METITDTKNRLIKLAGSGLDDGKWFDQSCADWPGPFKPHPSLLDFYGYKGPSGIAIKLLYLDHYFPRLALLWKDLENSVFEDQVYKKENGEPFMEFAIFDSYADGHAWFASESHTGDVYWATSPSERDVWFRIGTFPEWLLLFTEALQLQRDLGGELYEPKTGFFAKWSGEKLNAKAIDRALESFLKITGEEKRAKQFAWAVGWTNDPRCVFGS